MPRRKQTDVEKYLKIRDYLKESDVYNHKSFYKNGVEVFKVYKSMPDNSHHAVYDTKNDVEYVFYSNGRVEIRMGYAGDDMVDASKVRSPEQLMRLTKKHVEPLNKDKERREQERIEEALMEAQKRLRELEKQARELEKQA